MKVNKKQIYLFIGIVILIFIAYLFFDIRRTRTEEKDIDDALSSFTSIEEPDDGLLVTDEDIGSPIDNSSYPYRVKLTNMDELFDAGIITPALDYIEPYLSKYFDYYVKDGQVYTAVYVEDTFRSDFNFPSFTVYVEALDLEIDCLYIVSVKYYRFTSRFNPNGE